MKTLAQSIPLAGVLTDAYTPASAASVSSIFLCNRDYKPTTFRIAVALLGTADTSKQYLFYDSPLDANETLEIALQFGIPLAATDVLRVMSSNGQVSFTLVGEGP